MKMRFLILAGALSLCAAAVAQTGTGKAITKPVINVAKDGFPNGHSTPEGPACDLARAFIKRDVTLFNGACLKPFGAEKHRKLYAHFLAGFAREIQKNAKRTPPAPGEPVAIHRVFAARHLSRNGPASYGYAVFNFKDVEFVDVEATLQNGTPFVKRTLVVQDAHGKWYVHPGPYVDSLLFYGLDKESPSTRDLSEVYSVRYPDGSMKTAAL